MPLLNITAMLKAAKACRSGIRSLSPALPLADEV